MAVLLKAMHSCTTWILLMHEWDEKDLDITIRKLKDKNAKFTLFSIGGGGGY